MSIIDKISICLEEEKIIPINFENWNSFKLNHCLPENFQMKKAQYSYIKEQVGDKSGIYVYKKDDEYLYIGKAKPLFKRIKDHYIESFKPIPEGTEPKNSRWDRFFSEHSGEIEIYWKEFETEEERQLIEIILTKLLNPKFINFR